MNVERISILGMSLDCVDMDAATHWATEQIRIGNKHAIFAVNPEKIIRAQRDGDLRKLLNSAGLLIPDGIGAVIAARLLHARKMKRVPGSELMPKLCEVAEKENFRVFLFGAKPEINVAACERLKSEFPKLTIAGARDGYVKPGEVGELIAEINDSAPHILFVALGSPRQEAWIMEHIDELNVNLCQGVGGTFDVISGHVSRAPKIFRLLHLEWFYRLVSQPQRILRQTALPSFVLQVMREFTQRLFKKKNF